MKAIIYKSIDNDLLKEWERLWKKSPIANNTNSPYWFSAVLETFHYADYVLIALYENESLVGIASLVKNKRFGIAVYTVAPNDYVCGNPFLIDLQNKMQVKILIKELQSLGTVFLSNVPESFFTAIRKQTSYTLAREHTVNFFYQFIKDKNGEFIIPNKKKLLHKARKEIDKFSLTVTDGTDSEGLRTAFSIDMHSRKKNFGYNAFASEETKKFFQSLAKHFNKYFTINTLYYGKKPIAYEMGFTIGNTYYGNQIAFRDEYKKYAPGKVIVEKLLESLISRKVNKLDFGSGDSSIKRTITSDKNILYQLVISENTFIRKYLISLSQLRNKAFDLLQQHKATYKFYKKATPVHVIK